MMTFNEKYPLIKTLQQTSKGIVYVAENKSSLNLQHKAVVIKTFDKKETCFFIHNEISKTSIPKEMHFIRIIDDNSICPIILDHFETDQEFSVVMEYLAGQWTDLFDYTDRERSEKTIKKIIKSVMKALEKMMSKGIYHVDIKPENIMFHQSTYEVKILDFEDALYDVDTQSPTDKRLVGTMGYCAPEVFLKQMYDVKQSIVFMIGTLIYSCIESRPPFETKQDYENFDNILFKKCPIPVKIVIRKCLKKSPGKRIAFNEIMQEFWFTY